jgi:hypothetical protein
MRTLTRTLLFILSSSWLTGCVAYAPYPEYSAGPYVSYDYAYVRPVPAPLYRGGWGRHHGHHYGHHGHH